MIPGSTTFWIQGCQSDILTANSLDSGLFRRWLAEENVIAKAKLSWKSAFSGLFVLLALDITIIYRFPMINLNSGTFVPFCKQVVLWVLLKPSHFPKWSNLFVCKIWLYSGCLSSDWPIFGNISISAHSEAAALWALHVTPTWIIDGKHSIDPQGRTGLSGTRALARGPRTPRPPGRPRCIHYTLSLYKGFW